MGNSCGKTRYRTSAKAQRALTNVRRYGHRDPDGKKPARAYPCPDCHGWHLTSDPEQR